MQQRCYLDYWRVYVPGGSELLASTAQPVPADELLNGLGWSGQVESLPGEAGTQVFAGLLMLPPAQSSQIAVSYSLPPSIVQPIGTNFYRNIPYGSRCNRGLKGCLSGLRLHFPIMPVH